MILKSSIPKKSLLIFYANCGINSIQLDLNIDGMKMLRNFLLFNYWCLTHSESRKLKYNYTINNE